MQWSPPRKYKGLRTSHTHAYKVSIKAPERDNSHSRVRLGVDYNRLCEMEDWCEQFCTRNWSSFGFSTWYFDKPTEAVMFKMIFGGR